MVNLNVIDQVASMVLMMGVGAFLRKKQHLNDVVMKAFSNLLLSISLPFMIIYSFNIEFSKEILDSGLTMLWCALFIHVFLILLSQILFFRFDITKRYILHFSTIFSNCAFIGYPLAASLYGQLGVFYTAIFNICYTLFAFSYGIMLFTGKTNLKSLIVNPALLSTILGIFIFLFSVKLPQGILITLQSIGSMTTPISMFIIGAMLADISIKEAFRGIDVFYLSLVKLFLAPILSYLLLRPLIDNKTVFTVAIIMVAMPTGSLCGVFAEKYNSNRSLASRCTFLTTVFSVVTIPVVITVLNSLLQP